MSGNKGEKMSVLKKQTPVIFHFTRNKRTIVYDPASNKIALSKCNELDQYNRRIGRNIALGRIQKYLKNPEKSKYVYEFPKEAGNVTIEDVRREAHRMALV